MGVDIYVASYGQIVTQMMFEVNTMFYECGSSGQCWHWLYHSEAIENAYADLDSLIATGKPAL